MLIDTYIPSYDAHEVHSISIEAPPEVVYRALLTADLGRSWIIRGLIGLRALPRIVLDPSSIRRAPRRFTLQDLIDAGFGKLDEIEGEEIVLGISGRFWRPTGNVDPFDRPSFDQPVPPGRARAVWNFRVNGTASTTTLSTETRILCGDPKSRRRFLAYWFFVRPFSGLIRIVMLRGIARTCNLGT